MSKRIDCYRCGDTGLKGAIKMKIGLSSSPDREEWICLTCLRELLYYTPVVEEEIYSVQNMKKPGQINDRIKELKDKIKNKDLTIYSDEFKELQVLYWVLND